MNVLEARYPGINFPDTWSSFLDKNDILELKTAIDEIFDHLKIQYPNISAFPDIDPPEPDKLLNYFLMEEYCKHSSDSILSNKLIKHIYYLLRPVLSVRIRSKLQKYSLKNWEDIQFPLWPVDATADNIAKFFLKKAIEKSINNNSFIWYWPREYNACLILTHDIETKAGLNNCRKLMKLEEKYGFRSSFEVVPEKRYPIDKSLLSEMKDRGFEVCVHGLNHDGNLFKSRNVFEKRIAHIRRFAELVDAKGFRSPVMYRNPQWIDELGFSYDMSFPNTGRLDPQHGGCCTVFPFFNGATLEIPLTTTQDYSLLHIMKGSNINLWKKQIQAIAARNGVISFIIHPDYMVEKKHLYLYEQLLEYVADDDTLWCTLPGNLNDWWRYRKDIPNKNSTKHCNEEEWDYHSVTVSIIENEGLTYSKNPRIT